MIKRTLSLVLVLLMCLSTTVSTYAAEDKTLDIELDGKAIEMPAYVWEGELFLPLRAVSETLGYDVQWFQDKREITVTKPDKSIYLNLNDFRTKVNDHESYISAGFRFAADRTYIRQDFFSDNLSLKVVWNKDGNKAVLQEVKENSITIDTKREASETKTLKLTLQYPEIKGLDNTDVQNKLNALFAKLAGEAKSRGKEIEGYIGTDEIARGIKAEVYFNYQVKYNRNGLLSVAFTDYQYSGGAHGITIQSSYTFDLNTGTELELKDLFKPGSDYVSIISEEVKRQMEERGMSVLLAPFNSIKGDQGFFLSNNAVVVYFQAYEYLPYAFGIPEFAVDFRSMEGLLNPDIGLLNDTVQTYRNNLYDLIEGVDCYG